MIHLFLDGSSSQTLVGLTEGPFRILPGRAASDGALFQAVQEVLTEASLRLSDVDAIAVGGGPGSHTGTRAAAAAAKGLAMGANLPFKIFPSLLLTLPKAEGRIGTSLATRREKVYAFFYNTKDAEPEFSGLVLPEDLSILQKELDSFGHDLSPFHLKKFLDKTPPCSMNQALSYLQV